MPKHEVTSDSIRKPSGHFSQATVVALYLLAASNVRLRPQLVRQLSPGARIVAHNFGMGDWEPDAVETFRDAAGASRTLYLWTIDSRIKP